jgi:molybdopterin-guanine dinucleotide biosynthesis protein A
MDVLQQVASECFVVAPDADRFADLALPVYPDRVENAGALGGLYTALDAATRDVVIVVACDQPFLDARLLEALVARAAGADGAWVRTTRGVEPLLACYRRDARHRILAAIGRGDLKAGHLGTVLHMADVTEAEIDVFGSADDLLANINTPDDYARVQYRRR